MKTITMYELLGLAKDGKAPKKVKFDGWIWIFNKDFNQYQTDNGGGNIWNGYNFNILNNEVEILEEEKEIPEKLETYKEVDDEDYFANILKVSKNGECEIDEATSVIVDKVNEIIDYLDYLKSKGDE